MKLTSAMIATAVALSACTPANKDWYDSQMVPYLISHKGDEVVLRMDAASIESLRKDTRQMLYGKLQSEAERLCGGPADFVEIVRKHATLGGAQYSDRLYRCR